MHDSEEIIIHVCFVTADTIWFEDNIVSIGQENIAWRTDREVCFRNPPSSENPRNISESDLDGNLFTQTQKHLHSLAEKTFELAWHSDSHVSRSCLKQPYCLGATAFVCIQRPHVCVD